MQRQNFELLILGTSSAAPTTKRNPSAQLLNVAERFFLIDCGEATQIQLRKYKTKFQKIDHIFISHLHGDHFLGLPGFLASMHLLGRKQEINIYCPKELKEIIDKINAVSETRMSYEIKWHFTKNDKLNLLFEDEKVEVYSFPMKHRIFCTGFLFKEKQLLRKIDKFKLDKNKVSTADINNLRKGEDVTNADGKKVKNKDVTIDPELARSFAYCSDTVYDETLVQYIKDVDLLYHESTFLNDKAKRAEETFHSTSEQAAKIAKAAKVKQLILGHYSARYSDLTPFIEEASPHFKNVMLATEGKKFKI